jgi:hypothetical protein
MRTSLVIIITVVVLLVICGGGGAYFFFNSGGPAGLNGPGPAPAANVSPPAPSGVGSAPPSAGGPAPDAAALAAPKISTFIGQQKSMAQDADALAAPQDGAERLASFSKGMMVDVGGIVDGGNWAQITLPDKRVAYVAVTSLALNAPAAQAAAPDTGLDDGNPVEFDPASDVYTVTKPVTVYVEPNLHAPQRYEIDAGTSVPAVARSKDGVWVRASTEDGQPAFLLIADLGEPQKGKAVVVPLDDAPADLPDTVDGPATVTTTSNLVVGGQKVTLAGIIGEDGSAYVQQLQTIIDSQGGVLHCVRQDQAYLCKLSTGIDVALSALFNGGARPMDNAPPAYQSQAKSAQLGHRGLWHQ